MVTSPVRKLLFTIPMIVALGSLLHAGCDSGGNGGPGDDGGTGGDGGSGGAGSLGKPVLAARGEGIKTVQFEWSRVDGATSYRLRLDPEGTSGYSQIGNDLGSSTTQIELEIAVHLTNWLDARYQLQACNESGCSESEPVAIADHMLGSIGYFKASNAWRGDWFGQVALSGDGKTMAVGAPIEDGGDPGINGDELDESLRWAGAVYVFAEADGAWSQQAYIKASNPGENDRFGSYVAISFDGNTVAVGAPWEDSNGDPSNDDATDSGAVYVFRRAGGTWSQQEYFKASQVRAEAEFSRVALSADGNVLAVGAPKDNETGFVYVFEYDRGAGDLWGQFGRLTSTSIESGDRFGGSLSLSADGNTLAVGAADEDSSGLEMDNDAPDSGAAYVFIEVGEEWEQTALIKASNPGAMDRFGTDVAMSGDGTTLAVGAPGEASGATGVGGDQDDNSAETAGAVYIFRPDQPGSFPAWQQEAYIKASNAGLHDSFGNVALSSDGNLLVVGARQETSSAKGVDGNPQNDDVLQAGAAYVYAREGTAWSFEHYLKAPNTMERALFGSSVSLAADGNRLAIGASYESSVATGVGGDQNDVPETTLQVGAVYLY